MKCLRPFLRAGISFLFFSALLFPNLANSATDLIVKYKDSSTSLRSQILSHTKLKQKHILSKAQSELIEIDSDQNPEEVIQAIKQNTSVEYVERDEVIFAHSRPNDTYFSSQWALESNNTNIGAEKAWDVITNSNSLVIAIVDSGCDYTHEDLSANMWHNPNETSDNGADDDQNGYVDDYYGYDFQNNDASPTDDFEHGTLVAGIIAASGNNNMGISGISWNAQIMCLKVLDSNGNSTISKAVEAIDYAISHGAKIINMSWGYNPSGDPSRSLEEAIIRAQNAGLLVVASAGNGYQGGGHNNDENISTANYPSSYSQNNIIAVAATDASDQLASFSNYGAKTVDLGAPGVSILSTHPHREYSLFTGTSAAAPHVTGTLALVWAFNPNLNHSEIKRLVLESGDLIPSLSGKSLSGARLNIANAINASPAAGGHLLDSPSPFNAGNENTLSSADDDQTLSAQKGGCSLSVSSQQTHEHYLSFFLFSILLIIRSKKRKV